MLEIIALFFLTRHIGALAERKGEKPGTWKVYTVLAWFIGEILGLFIGITLFGSDRILMLALLAIPCAIGGYHIVRNMLEKKPDVIRDDMQPFRDNLVQ
jgi:hypothetical protein